MTKTFRGEIDRCENLAHPANTHRLYFTITNENGLSTHGKVLVKNRKQARDGCVFTVWGGCETGLQNFPYETTVITTDGLTRIDRYTP